jgi:hypothetical protein
MQGIGIKGKKCLATRKIKQDQTCYLCQGCQTDSYNPLTVLDKTWFSQPLHHCPKLSFSFLFLSTRWLTLAASEVGAQ